MLNHVLYDMNNDAYWDFEKHFSVTFDKPNGTVAVYRVENEDAEPEFIAEIVADDELMEELKDELRSGETPDGWEDGIGNTISL